MSKPIRTTAPNGLSLRVVPGGIDCPQEPTIEILRRDPLHPVHHVKDRVSADSWMALYDFACSANVCVEHARDVLGGRIREEFARQAEADACVHLLDGLYAKGKSHPAS